jgi:23S rRNA (adenine2503-C2)-methyltransferase
VTPLAGVDDSPAALRAVASALDPHAFRVNLIPSNPTGLYAGSSRDTIERFKIVLERARIPATVRLTRGRDIEAACGQLATGVGRTVHGSLVRDEAGLADESLAP